MHGLIHRTTLGLILILFASASISEGAFLRKKKKEHLDIIQQDALALEFLEKGKAAEEAGKYKLALKTYQTLFKKYANSYFSPEALYRTAKIRTEQKKWKKAYETFNTIVVYYPKYEKFNDILQEQFDIATTLATKKTTRFLGIIPFYNYDSAIKYFEVLVANAPYSDYAPLSLFQVGLIHKKRGFEIQAIDAFDRLVNNYPTSMLAPDAYRELAETFTGLVDGPKYDQGATRLAISNYEDVLVLFPDDIQVEKAEAGLQEMEDIYARSKLEMGEFYYKKRKNYLAARVFFNESITVAPNSVSAGKARDYLAAMPEPEPLPEDGQKTVVAQAGNNETEKIGLIRRMQFWRKNQSSADPASEEPEETSETIEVAAVDPAPEGDPDDIDAEEEEESGGRGIVNRITFWKKDRKKESPVSKE